MDKPEYQRFIFTVNGRQEDLTSDWVEEAWKNRHPSFRREFKPNTDPKDALAAFDKLVEQHPQEVVLMYEARLRSKPRPAEVEEIPGV